MTTSPEGEAAAEIGRLRQVVAEFRRRTEAETDSLFPAHADALLRLGSLLADQGLAEEALAAATEGVALYRALAEVKPQSFATSLASALGNLSNRLGEAGSPDTGLDVALEAVAVARGAMAADPGPARYILVSCLINLAGRYLRGGRAEECLNQLAEAVDVFKDGGEAGTPFLGSMIEALHRASMAFCEISLWGEAVDARRLMIGLFPGGPPPAMVQLLALTLQQASLALSGEGRIAVALQCADEAVELAQALFHKDPVEYKLLLAQTLGNQGGRRFQSGQAESGLDAVLEAVNLFHQVVNDDPAGAVPSLVLTLGTLSAILSHLGMTDQAALVEEQKAQLRHTLDMLSPQPG